MYEYKAKLDRVVDGDTKKVFLKVKYEFDSLTFVS